MKIQEAMSIYEKLDILSDAAKYDVACTSSGIDRKGDGKHMGNTVAKGICHSFSADGRCISLLKILFTNECVFDCNIVLTAVRMMCPGLLSRRRKSARLRWSFIGVII